MRIFIVQDKAIQNCVNIKTTSLYISTNTFQAISTFTKWKKKVLINLLYFGIITYTKIFDGQNFVVKER